MKINPFTPNSPSGPGMFAGRINEIFAVEKIFLQTRANKGHGFLLLGQRGIGKTSLLNLLKYQGEGSITTINEEKLNFLVIEIDITKETSQYSLIKKIELALKRKLARTEPTRKLFNDIWSFLGKIEAAGIKINTSKDVDEELLFEEFSYSLADTLKRVTNKHTNSRFDSNFDGILLIIDEADNANKELQLGSFVKLLYERLQKEGVQQLMIGIAGLPKTKEILIESHPSSLRIFEELYLDRLSDSDINYVLNRVLEHSKEINSDETVIIDPAKDLLIKLSEGFPHFIHQYGYCAFDLSDGKTITEENVLNGAFGSNGAIEKIGDKYYRDDYYNKIKVESYRQVLTIMAEKLDDWVTKKYIKSKFKGTEITLNNAISALRSRGIILSKEGTNGTYRLQDKGFAWWIVMNQEKEKKIRN
ncbi:AAA domain-containing protein [Pontibacter mucosus]|uniref:AAA domain-containing protein n=1 Tax=Pontibacter mucosus TaxID=1649266 RepID=A0A2T5Y4X2_9BACT|nr:ATP-binding protein [Pontibacter mucosus]PTX11332.1 AAA domain-containing protein [Pontibacter mucosus]